MPRTILDPIGNLVKQRNQYLQKSCQKDRMSIDGDNRVEILLGEVEDILKHSQDKWSAMGGGTELPFSYEITKLMDEAFTASLLAA